MSDDKIKDYLSKLSNNFKCSICGNNDFAYDDIYEIKPHELDRWHKNTCIPVIPVVCVKCGNTYFINAVVAGLVPVGPGES